MAERDRQCYTIKQIFLKLAIFVLGGYNRASQQRICSLHHVYTYSILSIQSLPLILCGPHITIPAWLGTRPESVTPMSVTGRWSGTLRKVTVDFCPSVLVCISLHCIRLSSRLLSFFLLRYEHLLCHILCHCFSQPCLWTEVDTDIFQHIFISFAHVLSGSFSWRRGDECLEKKNILMPADWQIQTLYFCSFVHFSQFASLPNSLHSSIHSQCH